jgi:hypothetical protein
MSSSLAARIAVARRHVETGRAVIDRQRNVISRKLGWGLDASVSQQLLVQFEISQAIFEGDLERLLRDQSRK